MSDELVQAGRFGSGEQLTVKSGALPTVNVRVHSDINGSHSLVTVQVTVVLPPHTGGAVGLEGNTVNLGFVPPEKLKEANHESKVLVTSDWEEQAGRAVSLGQLIITGLYGGSVIS